MSALSGGPCCTTCIRVEGAYGHAYPAKQPSNDTGGALNLSFAGGITAEALAVHPSGQYGAYACDDNVVLWAWKADKRLFLNCQGAVVSSCCFSSDGVYAFAGTSAPNPGVYVFDIAVGKPVQVALGSHRFQEFSSISHIAVAHDSRLVAAVETQKEGFAHLHIWDWTRGFVYECIASSPSSYVLFYSPVSCECLFSAAPRAVLWMPPGRIVTVCREEVILWAVFGKTVEKLARRAADASLYAGMLILFFCVFSSCSCLFGRLYCSGRQSHQRAAVCIVRQREDASDGLCAATACDCGRAGPAAVRCGRLQPHRAGR